MSPAPLPFGANTALTLPDRKVAAKTGTTNGFKDNYTMGYTPQLTVGVWVGNTDNESMENVTGLSGAAPIWNAVMRKYHEGLPAIWYDRPPGIVRSRDLPAERPAAYRQLPGSAFGDLCGRHRADRLRQHLAVV